METPGGPGGSPACVTDPSRKEPLGKLPQNLALKGPLLGASTSEF